MKNPEDQNTIQKPQDSRLDYLFKKKALIVTVTAVMIGIVLVMYGMKLSNRVENIEQQWTGYNEQVIKSARALSEIERYFGYGGLIHNFKNYILRKDSALVVKIQNDIRLIQAAIEKYQLGESQPDVVNARKTIRRLVDKYSNKLELVQRMIAQGKNSNEIDRLIQIDDRPAIKAFEILNFNLEQYSKKQVAESSRSINEALTMLRAGVIIIPVIIGLAVIIVLFIHSNIHTNAELEKKSEYLHNLFDAAPDAIFIINQNGKIIDANSVACNLLGYDYEEFMQMQTEQLMPERYRQGHEKTREHTFEKPARRPMNTSREFFAMRKDGTEIPVDISINYAGKGEEMHAITILRDITERKQYENNLTHKENILNRAQKITHLGSWEWNISDGSLNWSDEIFRIFGLEINHDSVSYDRFVSCIHPDDRESVVNAIQQTIENDKPYDIQHRILQPNGKERFVHEKGDVYRDENGKAQFMIGTVLDITEQKLAEAEMILADNVFSHTSEAMLITDVNNKILRVNEAFTRITGYTKEEVIGGPPKILKSGVHDLEFYAKLWRSIFETGSWQGEIIDKRKDGTLFPTWHNISTVQDSDGRIIQYISLFRDITEEKAAEEKIQNLAQLDQLTQLPNRMLFNDRLTMAIARAKRNKTGMALMFIDLDGFKLVNDSFGHQAGDQLLREVAERIKSAVREEDTVARLGGDEFTIILESLSHTEDAALVANKVIKNLSEKFQLDENEAHIGASIGIAMFPEDGINEELLIKRADIAMYHVKQSGKNHYCYYIPELEK